MSTGSTEPRSQSELI